MEGIACGMGIDNHLSFKQDVEGTRAMFLKESACRAKYCACVSTGNMSNADSYFDDADDKDY